MKKRGKKSLTAVALTLTIAGLSAQSADMAATIDSGTVQHSPSQVQQIAKYQTPVTITLGLANDTTITFSKGQTYDHNDVYDAYLKDMGIRLKNAWVVSSDAYNNKVNLSIASGDIPDLFFVSTAEQLKQLVDAGLVMDVTPYFDKNLTSDAKRYFTNREQMASATFNGKLMAIPATNSPYNSSNYLFIRKDWLQKVGLPAPKTMQDMMKVAAAFAQKNPGGQKTTYALAATNDLNNSALGLQGFFNGYHAYPQIWVKDAKGNFAYGSVQPQMKTALSALQQMYKASEIDPEFAVKDTNAEAQLIANNQLGMAYGYFWIGSWPLIQAIRVNNKITQDWEVYPLPSTDNQPAKSEVPVGLDGYYVISKKCKHPEAIFKLLNQEITMYKANFVGKYKVYNQGKSNDQRDNYWKLNPIHDMYLPGLDDPTPLVTAVKTHDLSRLKNDPGALDTYNTIQQYLKGDGNLWNTWMSNGPNGSRYLMYQLYKKGQYQMDAFYGAPTPTMTKQWGNLESVLSQGFMQIITGKQPVSYFDTLVSQWNALGGRQITQEVNQWNANASKQKVIVY